MGSLKQNETDESPPFSTNLTQAQSNRNHDWVVPVLDYSRAPVSRSLDKGNAGSRNEIAVWVIN